MIEELYNYDIYPKVFPVGKEVEITVNPLGCHAAFDEEEYRVTVHSLGGGTPRHPFNADNSVERNVKPDCGGKLKFKVTLNSECEYFVRIFGSDQKRIVQLSVYALEKDLAERLPFRGDLHMHTCRSDGSEDPAVVAANYRKAGYDFLAITDHHRYYPSLEAIEKFKNIPTLYNLVPGEEVHMPMTDVHIVNFGGKYSVNGILTESPNYEETDGALDKRSFDGVAPENLTREEYDAEIYAIADKLTLPEGVDPVSYAVCCWAFDHIKKADGLGIFAHPYWIADMWHIREEFTRYMMETHPFDAFEVLGGENYYEQNGFQAALYYEEWKNGRVHPIVGSTDSHGSTEHNRNACICSTIVFAPKNSREDLIASIKDKYSVAVDTISKEYRIVGEFRFQKYASFLLDNWYPIHDSLCQTEGKLMKDWYCSGDVEIAEFEIMKKKTEKLFAKYFAL